MAHAKPLLPQLTDNAQIVIEKPGVWEPRTAGDLDKLRRGLHVTPVRLRVNSIPDIWARPLLFEMSLFDPLHQLHTKTLGEWRGMLALLALRSVKNLSKLTVKPIAVKESENADANTAFIDAAYRLIPKNLIVPNSSWNESYLILFHDGFGKDRPIGMTSPTTLVYTSSYYFNFINGVAWFDAEFLTDPVGKLNAVEKPALAAWLGQLEAGLKGLQSVPDGNTDILDQLLKLVSKFISDIGIDSRPENFRAAATGFGISPSHQLFHLLERPADLGPPPAESPVQLVPSEGLTAQPKLLIVDKEISQQWGEDPRNIHVGNNTLADLPPTGHPVGRHTEFGGMPVTHAEIWNAVEFFTEKLVAIRVPNAFPGSREEKWVNDNRPGEKSCIIPVSEKLLNYISPDDLLKRLIFETLPDGDIKVTLSLTLGSADTSKEFRASKTYGSSDVELLENPVVELFPNFQVAGWKSYYLSYFTDNTEFSFGLRPWTVNQTPEKFSPPPETKSSRQEIWRLNEYPVALVCSLDNKEAGILIPSPPQMTLPQPGIFKIGVDFGASGTSVYIKPPNGEPHPLVANPRKLTITNLTDTQKARAIDQFLPNEPVAVPFLSLFRQFRNESGLLRLQPFVEGHIHYYSADSLSDLSRPDIYTDLKWSSDPQDRLRVRALLTQLCVQATAEVAALGGSAIEWKFSFPTAFSEDQQHDFTTEWNHIVEDCQELCGWNFQTPAPMTESVASGLYFRAKQNAPTALGALFIDIGSSTSDISLWQADDLLWQASLRLAGRDIFLKYLKSHVEVLSGFNLDVGKLSSSAARADDRKLWAETDAVLQRSSEEIFRDLSLKADTPEIKNLRQHLALGLSGLMYYVGLSIRHLMDAGVFDQPLPPVYFGGNGSRMLRWLTNGSSEVSPTTAKLIETFYRIGIGHPVEGTFRMSLSCNPKQEAAFGLVCDLILTEKENNEHKRDLVAGEDFVSTEGNKGPLDLIDKKIFKEGVKPGKTLSSISEFVKAFNKFADDHANFISPLPWDVRSEEELRGDIANAIPKDRGVVDVEPVFIIALRSLLDRNSSR